ncbi:MAG: YceI family protein [Alphaproteobacteria bacterium]
MRKLMLSAGLCAFALTANTAVFAESPVPAKVEAAAAQTVEEYEFDKVHTQVLFFVNHIGFSNSQGEFHDYDGHFVFDREHPENSSVEVTIQTASIDMDDKAWDDHMKNKDFFDVEKFPAMTFKSTMIKVTGEKTADIIGDLTILGVTKPATLNVTYNKSDIHPFSKKYVSGFSATAKVKRSEYGMNYGLPVIADDVEIRIEVEGMRKEAAAVEAAE